MPNYNEDRGSAIVAEAQRFLNLVEVKSNAKWEHNTKGTTAEATQLKSLMEEAGWQSGWPYCAAFCEAVWRSVYKGHPMFQVMARMLTPGCVVSFRNAAKEGWTSMIPKVGAIGVMKLGDTAQGHSFIVKEVKDDRVITIEANTSPAPGAVAKDREGDGIYQKERRLIFKPSSGKLFLLGFIWPA